MTIKETARFWQDAMARLSWGQTHQKWLDFLAGERPVKYPQSIGELCLEVSADSMLESANYRVPLPWSMCFRRDIAGLRRAMYHKNRGTQ